MAPFLGTLLSNALDDAALLLEVLNAWIYCRRRFGRMSLPSADRTGPHAGVRVSAGSGLDVAVKALTILVSDTGHILKNYLKAVRRAHRRAVSEVSRLAEECNAIGNFGDYSDARRVKLTQLNRAEARARASSERLAELEAQPGLDDVLRVVLTSIVNDCALLPFHTLRAAAVMGAHRAWWRRGAADAAAPIAGHSVPQELLNMARAGIAHAAATSGGAEVSRGVAAAAVARALLCGAAPACIQGFIVNARELVGRIGGDAAAPRGGSVGGSQLARVHGDSWERFHSYADVGGLLAAPKRLPPRADAPNAAAVAVTLEEADDSARQPAGVWLLAQRVVYAVAALPMQVITARCGVAGPFAAFGGEDSQRWVAAAAAPGAVWPHVPCLREALIALRRTLNAVLAAGSGSDSRGGIGGLLRRAYEGGWARGLLAGGDVAVVSALMGVGGIGFCLGLPSILTLGSIVDDGDRGVGNASAGTGAGAGGKAAGGLVGTAWDKVLELGFSGEGRARLWSHARITAQGAPYALIALATGRALVRFVLGGPSRKEWVRFAARRHFLRTYFYRHSEAYRTSQLQGTSLAGAGAAAGAAAPLGASLPHVRTSSQKLNVHFAASPQVSPAGAPPHRSGSTASQISNPEPAVSKPLSPSLKKSSFERLRQEHDRVDRHQLGSAAGGQLRQRSRSPPQRSPWGEIKPIEQLVDSNQKPMNSPKSQSRSSAADLNLKSHPSFDQNGKAARLRLVPERSNGPNAVIGEAAYFRTVPDAATSPSVASPPSWASVPASSSGGNGAGRQNAQLTQQQKHGVRPARPATIRMHTTNPRDGLYTRSPPPSPKESLQSLQSLTRLASGSGSSSTAFSRVDSRDQLQQSSSNSSGSPNTNPLLPRTATDPALVDKRPGLEESVGLNLSDDDLTSLQRRGEAGRVEQTREPLVEHTERDDGVVPGPRLSVRPLS